MTQAEAITKHLNEYGSITAVEAWDSYNIRRLASRISELKKSGLNISKENRKHKITGQKYVRYSLKRK